MTAALRPAETARSHAFLAVALRQCGADPAEAAGHLAASGDNDEATLAYAAAARRQLERIRNSEAMRLAEAIPALSGTTNGQVAVQAWRELEKRTGVSLADLAEERSARRTGS